jgi:hypothetical protein
LVAWVKIGNIRGPAPARYAMRLTSAADGTFSTSVPAGQFTALPVVTATAEAAAGRDYVVTLTSTSTTAVTGRVRQSRALPSIIAALTALAGYDPFVPVGGVIVHLTIQGAS